MEERIKTIKQNVEVTFSGALNEVTLNQGDFNWLIKRAEKVEELEDENIRLKKALDNKQP